MHIKNLVNFYQFVLKVMSENKIMTDEWNDNYNRGYKTKFLESRPVQLEMVKIQTLTLFATSLLIFL